MTRFSVSTKGSNRTVNYEGEVAYKLTPELDLYTLVCTSVLHHKFYTSAGDDLVRLRKLIKQVDPEFIWKLAIYARTDMHLRTIPLILVVEALKADIFVPHAVITKVIQRADEITEILGYYSIVNKRKEFKKLNKLANQLKRGIAGAFGKFDEYQLAKYNRDTIPSLKDAVFLTHPKPNAVINKLINDELEVPYTWETQLSEKGNTKEVWEELISSKKVGYMALLRNLRNISKAQVSHEHLNMVLDYLSHPESVRKSRQLPFRFWSAYKELSQTSGWATAYMLDAIERAAAHSAKNIPIELDKNILVACDVSGSMGHTVSPRSSVKISEIGLLFGNMCYHANPWSIIGMFGDRWETMTMPKNGIMQNLMNMNTTSARVGLSTNGHLVLEWLLRTGNKADKIFMFTDGQMWSSDMWRVPFDVRSAWYAGPGGTFRHSSKTGKSKMMKMWDAYKTAVPEAEMYLFDLRGYGNTPLYVDNNDVYIIGGWSDRIFEVLNYAREGHNAVDKIRSIRI